MNETQDDQYDSGECPYCQEEKLIPDAYQEPDDERSNFEAVEAMRAKFASIPLNWVAKRCKQDATHRR